MHNRKLLNIELGRVSAQEYKELPESGIVLVLDNIRSAHNVGSAFRTADSFKIDKVWLCGICAVPPSAEIHKSALGAEDSVAWEHFDDTMDAVRRLKEEAEQLRAASAPAEKEEAPAKVEEKAVPAEKPARFSRRTAQISIADTQNAPADTAEADKKKGKLMEIEALLRGSGKETK